MVNRELRFVPLRHTRFEKWNSRQQSDLGSRAMVMQIPQRYVRWVVAAILLMVLSSCSVTPDKLRFKMPAPSGSQVKMVWPEPPLKARYRYIGELRGEANKIEDPQRERKALSRLYSALVGLDSRVIPATNLTRPQQGVVDEKGRIYVVDTGQQAVFVFDEKLSEFSLWNESELGIPFISPVGIALAGNLILVSDSEQGVVFLFNAQGTLIKTIGSRLLKQPTGVAFDPLAKRIFVSDTANDNIKVFDLDGVLLKTIGKRGAARGEFNRPTFLSYKDQRLYVADSLNARVQIFNDVDGTIRTIGERGLYVGNFSRPKGVAVDSDGNIYVTESFYDHLLIFNSGGELLLSIGGSGSQVGKFSQPTAVWIDARDRVFVADMLNSRISIFQYLGDS